MSLKDLPLFNISFFLGRIHFVITIFPDNEQLFQPDRDLSNDVNTLENFSSIGFGCRATEFLLLLEVLDLLGVVPRDLSVIFDMICLVLITLFKSILRIIIL